MKRLLVCLLVAIISITAFVIPASAATAKLDPVKLIYIDEINDSYVKLKWDKVDGASKYAVYYSTKYDGKYTKYGNTSKTQVTIKKLKKNTKYYVKIKTLKTVNGKTTSSSYSDPIMFRTRKDKLPSETQFDGTQDKYGWYNIITNGLYIRIMPEFSAKSILKNRYSDYNGKEVLAVYAEIYNLSDEVNHLNQFKVKFFAPNGKAIDDLHCYFDSGDYIYEDILPGKNTAGVFFMPYSKVGRYTISFSGGYGQKDILVQFDIDGRMFLEMSDKAISAWLDGMIDYINENA